MGFPNKTMNFLLLLTQVLGMFLTHNNGPAIAPRMR